MTISLSTHILQSIVDVIKKGIRALMNSFVPYIPITVEICSYQLPLDQHMYIIELVKNVCIIYLRPIILALYIIIKHYSTNINIVYVTSRWY